MAAAIAAPEPEEPDEFQADEVPAQFRDMPDDWRAWSPEAKEALLTNLRGKVLSKGLGGPRKWRQNARPKQLAPSDATHWTPDENGFACGCTGPDEGWNIWMFMAGRGCGKTWAGSNWIIEQAIKHPGTVWAVVAPTFRDVRVTCFEGPSGIRRQLEPGEELQWRRNELRLDLVNGSIIYGYSADQPERLRGSNLSGAWCLPGDSLVSTARGDIPIRDVRPGEQVLTRNGMRRVLAQQMTRRMAPLVEVTTADGHILRCTPEHKIWAQGAWCDASSLRPGDTLLSCLSNSKKDRQRGETGRISVGTTTTEWAGTAVAPASCSLSPYGVGTTVLSRTDSKYTTATTTGSTITSKTWNSFLCVSTGVSTAWKTVPRQTPRRFAQEESLGRTLSGSSDSLNSASANSAASNTRVVPHTPSSVTLTAGLRSTVVATVRSSGWSDVYDLTIEGEHEFFADGILVHNCDEMGSWSYEETWYEGLVPALRIGEHPRVMVTTTPRPTHLIRDLFSRRDGTVHITTASTWENAKNLSAAALDELKRRYEGTRLGRQELEGELLEDLEGALWKRSDIDAARVKLSDVPDLVRIVVGIDPAVTANEDSDETGIIVAGDDGHGHGYVLADYSMKGTPEVCMREAVRAYKRHGADCIVAEVNNGGDFIGAVVRAVDANVPYRTVRATRGKALRAEPVSALAEQRRLHHVGSFPDLEDQLCSYVPGIGASPDRMDALVWAVFELRGLSQSSWLSAYGITRCADCENAYASGLAACPRCKTPNPLEADRAAHADEPEGEQVVNPGSWASVYRIKRCSKGHSYSDRGSGCPRCHQSGLGYLQSQGKRVDTRNMG